MENWGAGHYSALRLSLMRGTLRFRHLIVHGRACDLSGSHLQKWPGKSNSAMPLNIPTTAPQAKAYCSVCESLIQIAHPTAVHAIARKIVFKLY